MLYKMLMSDLCMPQLLRINVRISCFSKKRTIVTARSHGDARTGMRTKSSFCERRALHYKS